MSTYHSQKYAEQLENDHCNLMSEIQQIAHELRLAYASLNRKRPEISEALEHIAAAYPGPPRALKQFGAAHNYETTGHRKVRGYMEAIWQ